MEIIVEKNELARALARVQGIVEKKNTVPILSCVLLEVEDGKLAVSATDLEISLTGSYEAEIVQEGALTAPAKKIFEIVRELPEGKVRLTATEGGWVRLEMGRSRFKVMSLPKNDFPSIPQAREGERLQFESAVFVEMIDKTSFAMSHDQTRHALNGVLIEVEPGDGGTAECRMVATDGHRLAFIAKMCRGDIGARRGIIIPRKAVMELKRLIGESSVETIEAFFQDNRMAFTIGDSTMVTRLVEGQFPDYHQVIPKAGTRRAIVERDLFYRAVRRVSTLTAERAHPLHVVFQENGVTVRAVNPEVGEAVEDMEASFEGDSIEIGLNAKYILDVLSVLKEEKVVIEMNEELSPGLFKPEGDENYRCVIMPMRL